MRVSYRCAPTAAEGYMNFKQVPYDWSVTLEIPDGVSQLEKGRMRL
jgi:hypothetical protein